MYMYVINQYTVYCILTRRIKINVIVKFQTVPKLKKKLLEQVMITIIIIIIIKTLLIKRLPPKSLSAVTMIDNH